MGYPSPPQRMYSGDVSSGTSCSSVGSPPVNGRHGRRREHRHRRNRQPNQGLPVVTEQLAGVAPNFDGMPLERKRDDGTAPKQWNWAEEVVRASLDPQNQWEFP